MQGSWGRFRSFRWKFRRARQAARTTILDSGVPGGYGGRCETRNDSRQGEAADTESGRICTNLEHYSFGLRVLNGTGDFPPLLFSCLRNRRKSARILSFCLSPPLLDGCGGRYQGLQPRLRSRATRRIVISVGFTPLMRPAWPRVKGRMDSSLCRLSKRSPETCW